VRRNEQGCATLTSLSRRETAADAGDGCDVRCLATSDASRHDEAISRLYHHHADYLVECARRLLAGGFEAADIVQDVFMAAWQRADDYDPARGTVRAWLVAMTRSRALDALRARQAKKRWPSVDATEVTSVSASDRLEPNYAILHAGIALLPEAQRTLVDLAYFEGFSHAEIAHRTGLPLGTVKTRLRMATRNLRLAVPRESVDALIGRPPLFTWLERRVLGHLADIYFVDLVDGTQVLRTDWGHVDPAIRDELNQIWRFVPPASLESHPVRRVIMTARPELVQDASASWQSGVAVSEPHLRCMQRLGLQSLISQPILGEDRLIGSVTLVRVAASGRSYREADLQDTGVVAATLQGLG